MCQSPCQWKSARSPQWLVKAPWSLTLPLLLQSSYARGDWNPGAEVSGHCGAVADQRQSWAEILIAHCRALHQLTSGNSELAYVQFESMVLTITKVRPSPPHHSPHHRGSWTLPGQRLHWGCFYLSP